MSDKEMVTAEQYLGEKQFKIHDGDAGSMAFRDEYVRWLRNRIAELETKNTNLWSTVDSKQAKIDELMMEFCPGEMSAEQRKEWSDSQRPAAPPVVTQWQSIETAPHMRKIIVHYLNGLGKHRVVMACYYEKNALEMHDDYQDVGIYDDATGTTYADAGWYEEHDSEDPILPLAGEPTHWMPLPAAPSDETEGSR